MMYLLGEIWAYLVGAGIIGFLTGWFLQYSKQQRKINYLERVWKANMASLEMELKTVHKKADRDSSSIGTGMSGSQPV